MYRFGSAALFFLLGISQIDAYSSFFGVLNAGGKKCGAVSGIPSRIPLRSTAKSQSKWISSTQMQSNVAGSASGESLSFITRPRTTNANWGVFFEIATKDSPVWITGLHAGGHSFASFDDLTRLDIGIYTKGGTCVGSETDKAPWKLIAEHKDFILPRVEVGDSRAQYTKIPLNTVVHIPANTVQGFCLHTNKKTGLAVRRKLNFDSDDVNGDPYFREWIDGVTDENDHFKMIAGLCPGEKLFEDVSQANNARAFVGMIEYSLSEPK
mmetsp:Transcript_12870/g.29619  ORF Transcript_12870/g.29619 Transcript_12870/m.29619 type:complete len:267 (-) Transcript_12870:900-1700(-)